jgi:hypothetical protein
MYHAQKGNFVSPKRGRSNMKRNTLIAVVLCLMMIATVGASADSAKQENPRQAGKSSIYFYDVESQSTDDNGYGRLVINTDKKTFVFIGQDFTPMQHVHIKVNTSNTSELIAKGKSTKNGNLHIQGEWEDTVLPEEGTVGAYYYYYPAYGFLFDNIGGYVAHIKVRYSLDGGATWQTTDKQSGAVSFGEEYTVDIKNLVDDTHVIPEGALVKMKLVVVGGDDIWSDETFSYGLEYPPDGGYCWPYWYGHGPTWNAYLEYDDCDVCRPYIDSDVRYCAED